MDEGDRGRPSPVRQAGEQQTSFGGQPYNNTIPYQAEYPQESQTRQQSFPAYNPNIMYNISQSSNQQYGSVQTYPPRQNAAIEVLSSQFSGTPQYYVPGDSPTPVGSTVTPHHHQPVSQFSSPSYSQYSPATSRLQPPYSSSLSELNHHGTAETTEEGEYSSQPQPAVLDEAYSQYQTALKRTFQNMREGRLGEAGTSLLTISDWLLSNAVELGLVRDEQELHGDRTRLWNEFNTCWLSVLRKEKEMLREYLATGQTPLPPQEFLREEFLERMGRELVRLCDNMERHGLVDYQMGVWEEEIIDGKNFWLKQRYGN
ncbi:hypothetical protein EDC01DRAFT_716333 [Geopyxis carbonaria]|nr:hypothetical protein EDC01DRAFT_716333 [Geopyxis carbonaria]